MSNDLCAGHVNKCADRQLKENGCYKFVEVIDWKANYYADWREQWAEKNKKDNPSQAETLLGEFKTMVDGRAGIVDQDGDCQLDRYIISVHQTECHAFKKFVNAEGKHKDKHCFLSHFLFRETDVFLRFILKYFSFSVDCLFCLCFLRSKKLFRTSLISIKV